MGKFAGIFLLLCLSGVFAVQPATSLPTMPVDSGFGAKGVWETDVDSLAHPKWRGHHVYLFHPHLMKAPAPVVFFCHGIGAENPQLYAQLIRHIVSWGYAVLYPQYSRPMAMGSPLGAYKMMQAGLDNGIKKWPELLDTTRIGFVGHSFGAGAVPALSWDAVSGRHWGQSGAFLFIMAPWYSYRITQDQLDHFPGNVKAIIETFDDDRVNDPRMAIDLFKNLGVPKSEKEFIRLDGDTCNGLFLAADHDVPQGTYPFGWNVNVFDYYGVYRLVNALAAYAFKADASAKAVALGHGSAAQRYMGRWTNGRLFRESYTSDAPALRYPQALYMNFWNHAANPRARSSLTFDTSASTETGFSTTIGNYALLNAYRKELRDQNDKSEKAKADSLKRNRKGLERKNRRGSGNDDQKHAAEAAEDSAARWPIRPIESGFGGPGPFVVKENIYPHPSGGSNYLYCFIPQGIAGRIPVVFFAPELQTTGKKYRELLRHIASRGCIVVSSTYRYGLFISDARRYETLLQGFAAVIELVSTQIDTTRVGFAGHSYGAGAIPAISWHFLDKMGWGQKGAFLFLMSPSYVHFMTQSQFERFPLRAKLVVEVFESDHWNDYRIAEDIFYSININPSEKDFLIVKELSHGKYKLNADYQTPYCEEAKDLTAMHFYAIFRPLDALIEYSFRQDPEAKKTCLGNGVAEQVYMGTWWDGEPATPLVSTDMPQQVNKLWPHEITGNGIPAFFNWIWPFPYSCNFYDKRNERRTFLVP